MKHLLTFVFITALLIGGASGAHAQQTPANTVCNEESGLQWNMNVVDNDVKDYQVYVANQADIANANPPVQILVTVPHDPTKSVIDADGNKVIKHSLNSLLAEGPKYFVVRATDTMGNISGYSNEIGCEYNVSPGAPTIQLIFTKVKP